MIKTAALLTCFNRKDITLKCLRTICNLREHIDIFLVDDRSTDGTFDAVNKEFPEVKIIKGNGNLFWNRGMHLAWKTAIKESYDFFLLINDDVLLYDFSFKEIFECSELKNNKAIISGVIDSSNNQQILYGGYDSKKKLLVPDGVMKEITFMNGNFVLVPKAVYEQIGIIDPVYHHDLGDVDYGLRAKKNNISVYTTRVPVGTGIKNEFCRVRYWGGSLSKRFIKLYSPLGNNPSIGFYFRKNHYGYLNAIKYYIYIHILNLLSDSLVKLLFGTKYMNGLSDSTDI